MLILMAANIVIISFKIGHGHEMATCKLSFLLMCIRNSHLISSFLQDIKPNEFYNDLQIFDTKKDVTCVTVVDDQR